MKQFKTMISFMYLVSYCSASQKGVSSSIVEYVVFSSPWEVWWVRFDVWDGPRLPTLFFI